jgi:hypothetical protein
MINAAGVTQDAKNKSDTSWNPDLTVKCAKEEKAWTAEIKIPFKELGVNGKNKRHIWSINLNRSARDPENPANCEDTAWAPTEDESSHVPWMFGYMWLDAFQGDRKESEFVSWRDKISPPVKTDNKPAQTKGGSVIVAAIANSLLPESGGELLLLSASGGTKLSTHKLPAAPVFDGLSIANGKIFVSLQDGTVMCFGAK